MSQPYSCYAKPLSDVDKWPTWVILTFFTPPIFRLAKVMESVFWWIFQLGTFTQRLGNTLLSAVERGYIMRGWCEPMKDGGFILGVYPKKL